MPHINFFGQVMTRFIRHPTDIPIEVKSHGQLSDDRPQTVNLSLSGLAFRCDREFTPGDIVDIRIPLVRPPFQVEARVIWCGEREQHFELGVEFLDQNDIFLARMVEQVCHIEQYRQDILRIEKRTLSSEEAAAEWIRKFASEFPVTPRKQ